MHINWRDLQTIEALVRAGSLVSAASELGLTHTSVSRRIDALEKGLGAPLFLRGHRLQPTPMALLIADKASGIRSSVGEIEALVASRNRSRTNRIGITTNDVLAPLLMRAIAAAELAQRVVVHVSDKEEVLDPGRFDFALRPSRDPAGTLRGSRVGRARLGVFQSKSDRRTKCPWVAPSADLRSRHSMRWLKVVPPDANVAIECGSLLAMRDACAAGLGKAPLPAFAADERLKQLDSLETGPSLWLLSPASRRSDPRLKNARAELRRALQSIENAWA